MKKNIIVHIGHGKTGTSYLQSVFALNKENLKEKNIIYLDHQSDIDAVEGRVSSGNGEILFDPSLVLDKGKNYLFSNENLFGKLLVKGEIEKYLIHTEFNLKVILYTRNPYEQIFSRWGQFVKRGNETRSLDEFLLDKKQIIELQHNISWIKASKEFYFDLKLRNYSKHKHEIAEVFFKDILGDDYFTFDLKKPKNKLVNRSLTLSELELQRNFNKNLQGTSTFISDVLVNSCPDIEPHKLKCSKKSYDFIYEYIYPLIEQINSYIPHSEHILIEEEKDIVSDAPEDKYEFSKEQIQVLAESISKKLHQKSTANLIDNDANTLRDISMKIFKKDNLDLNDALRLMQLAKKARPSGPFINQKVNEWTAQLEKINN